ncbi:ComEA family DNA-binding protein [Peptoniphilus sp. AGMB00490]|uniref:ComEA family DNA-binding protein n=2 Tax=Peptoniphilus TaxID=162289 RepID=A0A848RJ28_9FIRM|nr:MULTISPECIES: helix-hairpin-helix domain-containing protein [Peptoniphilus]NMW84332.1 ComEA family DNA-binding protein [Peptoniphilus faecalis]
MDFKFFKKDNIPYIIIISLCLIIGYQYYDSHKFDDATKFLNTKTSSLPSKEISKKELAEEDEIQTSNETKEIMVHISGAVKSPGILKLDSSKRVVDAVYMAGGATDEADLDRINLAAKLHDEEKIYIPKINEVNTNKDTTQLVSSNSSESSNVKININTADATELQKIPGVGPKTAEKIINYRSQNSFSSIEDIKNVDGIGDKKFESMKDFLSTY